MAKIKFVSDGKVDGEIVYNKGETYEISNPSSIDRWLKRGHQRVDSASVIKAENKEKEEKAKAAAGLDKDPVVDADAVVEAELDTHLAKDLEKQGKVDHVEVESAQKKEEAVKGNVIPKHKHASSKK